MPLRRRIWRSSARLTLVALAVIALTLSLTLFVGCASEQPGAASDSQGTSSGSGETSCDTPNEGCACDQPGEIVDCGKIAIQVGDHLQCTMGDRTCGADGKWGGCEGDKGTKSVAASALHTSTLATSTSTCAKNLCDPYCGEYKDTPQGVDAGTGFKISDAGLTLNPTGTFSLSSCTGLTVTPVTSTTMTLTTLTPAATDVLKFKAALVPAGCYPGVVQPVWTIDDSRADALTITGADDIGTLAAISSIAGPVTVVAHVGSVTGSVLVNVNVNVTQVDTGFATLLSYLNLSIGLLDSAQILYPYENTVFPLGLPPPIPQWTSPLAAAGVKVALRANIGTSTFLWTVVTAENNALQIVAGSPGVNIPAAPRYPSIPTLAWQDFERSAKGQAAQIVVQRLIGTTRYGEMVRNIKFANGQLKGNLYYQSYGTRLTYNYTGASDSTGGTTFPSGKFGAATLGIAPGALQPTVIAGQSANGDTSGNNCRVCHTASSDGSVLITQKSSGSNGSSMMETNLTATTPTETPITYKTDGTYSWPAIFPTGGFLFGNAGVQLSYSAGPPPGGLDGSNAGITSSFWSLASSNLGQAKTATYRTTGGTPTSLTVGGSAWGLRAGVPSFSHTGNKVAMNFYAGSVCATNGATNCSAEELKVGDKRSLAIMDWNNTTATATSFKVINTEPATPCSALHPTATCTDLWPTFFPNDAGLVWEKEIFHNGLVGGGLSDFGGTRSGCDNSGLCNNDGTKAELWWVNITGTAQPKRLNNAMGLDASGTNYLPTGANSAMCTASGFFCSLSASCCSGTCTNNRCTGTGFTPLKSPGTSCSSNSECENNKCNAAGKCGCLATSDCALLNTCNTTTGICSLGGYAGPPAQPYTPGHNAAIEPELNYEPTMDPTPTKAADGSSDEYYWMVFTSRRQFGNIATGNPWWSDPRRHDLSQSVTTKKLWIAAVSPNPSAGTDPSFPAFYVPGQEWVSGNSKAYWVQNACKVGSTTKSSATICDTTQDCCSGSSCKLDFPITSPATRHCLPTTTCQSAGGSCSTSSDCCSGFLCSSGTCTDVPPISLYGTGATYSRDYTNPCTPGTQIKWGTFEYQGTFPTGTSLTVKARTAATAALLPTASPQITVGTANTTTTDWTYLPIPAQTLDALFVAAGSKSNQALRVEMTLTPSSNQTASPTLANWRVDVECTPSE